MKWCAQFNPLFDDLVLAQPDQRRYHFKPGLRAGSHRNQLIKNTIIFRAAVRVAGTVRLDRADIDSVRADDLGPGDCNRKKVGVTEGNIAGWDVSRIQISFAQWNRRIGQGRTPDPSDVGKINGQTVEFEGHPDDLQKVLETLSKGKKKK